MTTPCDILFRDFRIQPGGGQAPIERGWLAVTDRFILALGPGEPPAGLLPRETVKGSEGQLLMPGAIDEHVHFRDPGLTHKADMATESAAAVAGGVTSFLDMPNTKPQTTSRAALADKLNRAAEVAEANYGFYIGATADNFDEILHSDFSAVAGVKIFLGSSTGNMLLDDQRLLRRLFTEVPALFAVHAESEPVIAENIRAAREGAQGGEVPVWMHPMIRSRQACYEASARIVALARETGARLHLLHVSTADELALIDPVNFPNITAETCPQYLLFDFNDYSRLGTRIKCNPAIKMEADRRALTAAVADGTIAAIATDHAPHLLAEKQGDALTAVSGMPMIQFSLPVMLSLADRGLLTEERVVDAMCTAPAQIFRIQGRGALCPGNYADLVVVERLSVPATIEDADVVSRCGWTPLAGSSLTRRVVRTWVNGQTPSPHAAMPLRFG